VSVPVVVPASASTRFREATLAGLAEACVLALPVHLVISESGGPHVGVATFAAAFAAAFTGSVYVLSRFRHVRDLPLVIGAIAAGVGIATAGGDLSAIVLSVAASALIVVRVARIAFRSRLDPLHGEIAWGAVGLGVEALLAAGGGHLQSWRFPISVLIPAFFIASFASRALSVWDDPEVADEDRSRWLANAHLLSWCFAALMFAGAVLGLRGGGLDRLGELATRGIGWVLYAFIQVLLILAQPVFWLFERIHLDPEALRRVLNRLQDRLDSATLHPSGTDTSLPWARFLGFLVLALIVFAAYRSLRRIRPEPDERAAAAVRSPVSESPLPTGKVQPVGRKRRELPADRVRRCYAETLLALERSGVAKEGSLTPAEFARIVAEAYPWAREGFGALTRAYEDVRYGGLRPHEPELRDLDRHHHELLQALRRPRGPEHGRR
jgi:hypothetical protein